MECSWRSHYPFAHCKDWSCLARELFSTFAYLLLSDYLVLLLLVTLRFDTCFIASHGCPCLVATHAVGIPKHLKNHHMTHRETSVPKISDRMSRPSPLVLLITFIFAQLIDPALYHDVDKWVKSNSASAYSGRFLGHCPVEDSAKDTNCMPLHSYMYLEIKLLTMFQVIHKNFKISRIRNFYMRKVRFTQDSFDEKLGAILTEFPILDVGSHIALTTITNVLA